MLALLAAVVVLADPSRPADPPLEPKGWGQRFLGKEASALLSSATRVKAFRIVSHDSDEEWRAGRKFAERVDGYVISGSGAPPSAELLRRLVATFLSDETYERLPTGMNGSIKLCGGFHPGVLFRFFSGKKNGHAISGYSST